MKEALIRKFQELGVDDPESWAQSQLQEGFDQLARATVLSTFVDRVIDTCLVGAEPHFTRWSHKGRDLWRSLIDKGVDRSQLAMLCMIASASSVDQVLMVIDGNVEMTPNPDNIDIGLFAFESDGEQRGQPDALHESFSKLLEYKLKIEL